MKTKSIFMALVVVMICLLFSTSEGTDRFYYGTWGGAIPEQDFPAIKDSLKFNIVVGDVHSSTVDSFRAYSLRAIVQNYEDENSPRKWASQSHYTLWEAEGLDSSYFNLIYNGGEVVNDPSASGGKARVFTGPATPRLIQWGPTYSQEPKDASGNPISYKAMFCLQYTLYQPRVAGRPHPVAPVCSIMVVDSVSDSIRILKAKALYPSDLGVGYKEHQLDYTVSEGNPIQFRIYWFGGGVLWVDYVKVYDDNGRDLIDRRLHDQEIIAYVNQSWVHTTIPGTGDTVVYRWYLKDQPEYIDAFEPGRYIDSLLRVVSSERVGHQAFCHYWDDTLEHEYSLRENSKEYDVDIYPTGWAEIGTNFTGPVYQEGWNRYTGYLNRAKTVADSLNKDLWLTVQAHTVAFEVSCADTDSCQFQVISYKERCYCCQDNTLRREPTPNEVRLQTFLALCYGADAIMYYKFPFWTLYEGSYLETGLYDSGIDSATSRFWEIEDFTGPRAEKLGPIIKNLTWQGACPDDSVGSFTLRNAEPSYIKNIVPHSDFPPYVEVGFFTGPYMGEGNYDYFMLVNRRCLPGEGDSFRVFIETDTTTTDDVFWMYGVEDVYSGWWTEITPCGQDSPFTVFLEPGEGKLFWVSKWWCPGPRYVHVGPSEQYTTIQGGIDAANSFATVLVDTGIYRENINFKGKSIMVASKFHTTGDTSYISRTIIDGSCPTDSDSASVVRFVSRESFCACLKGFTLKNGSGTKTHTKEPTAHWGGGIVCCNSSPTIANNIIVSNHVELGSGGGIYCDANSSPRIINNIIKENMAGNGGGISGGSNQTIIANNLIVQNRALQCGGGIDLVGGIITNNTIAEDSAGSGWSGGGIFVSGSTCQITNNIIAYSISGGGIRCAVCPQTMSYNDLWNDIDFIGCSGWGDTTWGWNRNGTRCDSYYNIIRDPYLWPPDYHLSWGACIDAGDNNAPALPTTDLDGNPRIADGDTNGSFFVDMGAYEYPTGGYGGFAKIAGGDGRDTGTKSSLSVPDKFSLLQNYPNPFNPATVVKFEIVQPAKVNLKIYNILGRLVKVLVDEEKVAGTYTTYWDGNDQNGQPVSSGIYFYKLDAGNLTEVKKMVLIK